jgi:hypothetical protein
MRMEGCVVAIRRIRYVNRYARESLPYVRTHQPGDGRGRSKADTVRLGVAV